MKEEIIISVDAGGTSTRFAVINKQKEILHLFTGPSGSPAVNINAEQDIFNKLFEIYPDINKQYQIKGIVIGMSGFALVNVPKFLKQLQDEFKVDIILDNDAYLALYSILQDQYQNGIVVISGTGAIVLADNNNVIFNSNGWGERLTERGSGFASVRDFVCEMIHEREETGTITKFQQQFMDYMGYKELEDFKMLFYRHGKDEVASYCRFFLEEGNKNNPDAIAWLKHNGRLLGMDTLTASRRVNLGNSFPIGFRGGFISGSPYISEGLIEYLKENGINPIVVEGDHNPIFGGYYLAKKRGMF